MRNNYYVLIFFIVLGPATRAYGQNDVMMQAFYWDVPVDAIGLDGFWWDSLAAKAPELSSAGISAVWVPSPSKGNFGINDMGYGIFDHYDLGNYDQKGTIETRFGSRSELISMVDAIHLNGIDVYADMVLNHMYTSSSEEETNPAVKQYVFDEARRDLNGDGPPEQYRPFPTNEIRWRISLAQPGDYYIKIKGYHLDCSASFTERGYDLYVNWDGSADQPNAPGSANWESEPNDGGGSYNVFPGSGQHVWAHMNTCSDVDEYLVSLPDAHEIELRLEARRESTDSSGWTFAWADQTNGYYPFEVWHNGSNLTVTTLEARTNTGVSYVNHTGTGEPNYSWSYAHFHPVDNNDYLGYPGSDEVIPNTRFFGNDFNTYDPVVQDRLKNWGTWLTNTVGFDGYRLDFVRGVQEAFLADWINAMPAKNGSQRFVVGEYWGSASRINQWVTELAGLGADADAFDFPLKSTLTSMANGNTSWDMRWLNDAGMVRNDEGNSLPGTSVVTFVENHDTGKEHDKWVTKDWDMAYAYILFAEGRPTIFYSHFYGVNQVDAHDPSHNVQAPASLQSDIRALTLVRNTYLDGAMIVLSEIGNPYPSGDAQDVYVARRQGNGTKSGAILVLNNHETASKGLWVDNAPESGYVNWAGKQLVSATDEAADTTHVYDDGRVYVWAPPRDYAIWLPGDEFEGGGAGKTAATGQVASDESPTSFKLLQNYPNPFNARTNIRFSLSEKGHVHISVFDVLGQHIETLQDGVLEEGGHQIDFDATHLPSGVYVYRITSPQGTLQRLMTLIK